MIAPLPTGGGGSPPPGQPGAPAGVVRLLAGFDAGQTHTTCRLAAEGGGTLAEGEGPGVVHLAAPQGPQRFRDALRLSLAAARSHLPAAWAAQPLAAAAVGASGIEVGSAAQGEGGRLAAAVLELPTGRLLVTGDERTALRGAFPAGAGIVVICGTGTIAVGRDGLGREHRCAGWGWLLDGAGSAMDVGRDGLALSLRMADGRAADSPLRDLLWRALELDPADPATPQRIKALVVDPGFGAAGFARLAPVVAEGAAAGDAGATAILERNAEALAAMAAAVARRLDLQAPLVCGLGGALLHLAALRQPFERALGRHLPHSRLVSPGADACGGAVLLAGGLLRPEGSAILAQAGSAAAQGS